MVGRICPNCGHELSPAARFCSACGAPIDEVLPPQASFTAPVHYTPPHLAERILAAQAALEARGDTEGERKTVTALFADMAGSTALIHDLDPEEAHRLITPVLALMMEAVHHYEGYVAKSLGDGILALFGAPIAHEDHPQRALYAALRMQEAMRRHGDRIRLEQGILLQIRIGVHTGEVVVRSIHKDDLHADYDPVGHTIHIASRMETIAAPSSILVSASTHKLAEGYFSFRALGATHVKGIPEPLDVYEVMGLGALRTRLQVAAHHGLARFVGRRSELAALRRALRHTTAGRGQFVAVEGDAGVGKSRLFHEFKARSQRGCLVLETFSVSHGKSFAYLPLIEMLRNYFRVTVQDDEQQCRKKIADRVLTLDRDLDDQLPYLLHLLGIGQPGSALVDMDPRIRRERTFEAITRLLARESLDRPIALLFEDLQWLDRETEAFLGFLIDRVVGARILLLVNYRSEYQPVWSHKHSCIQLRLDPLGEIDAQGLLATLLGGDPTLGPLKELILKKTEGNPFFIEEVVQTLAEEKALRGEPGHFRIERTPAALQIPTTVQAVLASRIDRLHGAEKELLQTLAVIGKEFPWSLIQEVVQEPEEVLRHLLSSLQSAGFIYERPAFPEVEYSFKHALTQEVAGHSLLTERRSMLHERTAKAIETLFPSRLKDYCSELAHHYSLSANIPKAVEYLHCTGQQALQRSATLEAIQHLSSAMNLLKRLPDTSERARQELTLQLTLATALMTARGYGAPEVKETYTRALALCEQVGETLQRFSVQMGLRTYYTSRAEYAMANELGERLLRLAQDAQDQGLRVEAHSALGASLFFQGDLNPARTHQEQVLALYDPGQHHPHAFVYGLDPGIRALSYLALNLWFLGYPDQARKRSQEALALAQKVSHPFSLAFTLTTTAMLREFRGEAQLARKSAESAIALSTKYAFPFWLAWGTILRGWVLAKQGRTEKGIAQITQGLAAYQGTGAELGRTYFLSLLAAAYRQAGQAQAALSTIAEALAMVEERGERYCEAELHRLKGELILHRRGHQFIDSADEQEAEVCFHAANGIARQQSAKSLELRATLSLAQLWRTQGKTGAALERLAETYSFFTEGFETHDLQAAKTLLGELASKKGI